MKKDIKQQISKETQIGYDTLLYPVFKCNICGTSKLLLIGITPKIVTNEGAQDEDALYCCDKCDALYYLSEINGV